MQIALVVLDIVLALGAALRLTRFVVADDVPGGWYIRKPVWQSAWKHASIEQRHTYWQDGANAQQDPAVLGWRGKVASGLGCPYCMSVWMAALVTVTLFLAGGVGDAADWWRYPAGFLTLAWLTGHIAARAGDTEE